MTPIEGLPILSADRMRAAEQRAIDAGISVETLMQRAGEGVAEAIARLAGATPVLILCGPGNNGGDGYVAARVLAERGHAVRVAESGSPSSGAAKAARAQWSGAVEPITDAEPAPFLVDSLFGTGLSRPLDASLTREVFRLAAAARYRLAVDLPSGIATDTATALNDVPQFDLTLALGAVKPAHMLQPAARYCGATRVVDLGIDVQSDTQVLAKPTLTEPGPEAHKYTRGYVAIVQGAMAGAAELAAIAAARSGAGYVALLGGKSRGPFALVEKAFDDAALSDDRIGALLIGLGLGRDDAARKKLARALTCDHPLVIDGDALHLLHDLGVERLLDRAAPAILTPHAGEFATLFGPDDADKLTRTRAAAARAQAVVVHKGADTVIADAHGHARIATNANDWLSTAGTGDVLAGTIAAQLASGLVPIEAAAAGVWLHGAAARRLGKAFIADDLAHAMTAARAGI